MRTKLYSVMGLCCVVVSLVFLAGCEKEEFATARDSGLDEAVERRSSPIGFYALTNTNQLVKYISRGFMQEQSALPITGLQSEEFILAIDFRPATGQLYGVSNQSRLYFFNLNTGAATALSMTSFSPAIDGARVGFDFNPTVDRIRLVTDNEQNLRLHPETGMVAVVDGKLNPEGVDVAAVAYTNSFAGTASTALYDIDVLSDNLYKQNPPNNGTLELVGAFGIDALEAGGFDISADNSRAIAALRVYDKFLDANVYKFFSIDLKTGKARNEGRANSEIIGLAIQTNPVAYAVDKMNNLHIFNPQRFKTVVSKSITGMQMGETVLGIDMRPATGQLYALGSSSRLYTINMSSGAATAIADIVFDPLLNGTSFGFDFNPTVDRIRIVSNKGQNLRAHPVTGVIAFVDGDLNPGTPAVDAVGYQNNFAGATSTSLYDVDVNLDKLFVQSPPNSGTLVEVGNLGMDIDAANGFDIGGMSGEAYGIFSKGANTFVYSVNLSTGKATPGIRFSQPVSGFALGLGF